MYAFCALGEIFVASSQECQPPLQITFGADLKNSINHGLADFVAQEEMDRYRGFWWSPDSKGILFAKVDESKVPQYRITHHERERMSDACMYEDHRYPFAGKANPSVKLAYVHVNAESLQRQRRLVTTTIPSMTTHFVSNSQPDDPHYIAQQNWKSVMWFDPPREASEYLARLTFLPDGSACAQWQSRTQNCLVLTRMNLNTGKARTLLVERSDVWINLHHLIHALEKPIHPKECQNINIQPPLPDPLPEGSFSFLFGSERSGFCHLYLYTYVPNLNGEQAMLMRQVSAGDWMVESIVGVSLRQNAVYITGTFDSELERHLYALPIIVPPEETDLHQPDNNAMDFSSSSSSGHPTGVRRGLKHVMNALSGKSTTGHNLTLYNTPTILASSIPYPGNRRWTVENTDLYSTSPLRLTVESGMHAIVMDPDCTKFVDTSSDLGRPTTVKIYNIPEGGPFSIMDLNGNGNEPKSSSEDIAMSSPKSKSLEVPLLFTLYDALRDDKSMDLSSDFMAHLPAPELMTFPSSDGTESLHAALYRPDTRIHGPGPYPLICAVYGGPHVQRVNKSWGQCADMRAQRLRSLGFCVVKCDNRGSSRRGLAFESAISQRLGRLEVLDQVAVVRQLTVRGIADPTRVGIYGWSYGGYLSAMCLCRAPDVFHVAVAGAPVTSWDGYDTHYTERYMGLPSENPNGYRESAVFDHVPNMRGKLLLVHGLIDENVHFRHTARLINRLIAAGKDYDLLLFPDERHSPRRLRDRIYMEQRISDYFLKHLSNSSFGGTMRAMAGL
jgi:dipeptidyl aminopeptidase/acylaminoacyl peptidase